MASTECLSKIWDMISQFVCWEFCRHSDRIFNNSSKNSKTDLISFFRDMVIEMTMKHEKSDIAKSEILAKFIEELNCAVVSKNFDPALQFVPSLNLIFPELQDNLEDFLNDIEEKCEESNRKGTNDVDSEIFSMIKEFSIQAFELLPLPDLFKVYQSWQNNTHEITVSAEVVKQRLLQEKSSLMANKAKILKLIATDNVYRMCLNGKNTVLSSDDDDVNYTDALSEENDTHDSSATTIQDDVGQSDVSSVFEDCESDWELDNKGVKPKAQRSMLPVKSPSSRGEESLFYSCPDVESPLGVQECHVVLEDVTQSQDQRIQNYLVKARSVIKPRNRVEEESLSSNSEEDFIESPPKKFFRGWQKGSKSKKSPKFRRPSKSPDKRVLRKRLCNQKIICHFCRRSFRSSVALQSHDCNIND